jgi:hypothetical protein
MRFLFTAAALGLLAVPALPSSGADAQSWRYGRGDREVRQELRECRRELRRADSRREYRRELRECRRELRDARRDYYDGWHDRRWYGRGNRHYRDRYRDRYWWDGRRWRSRW